MKICSIVLVLSTVILAGCAGMGGSPLAQALHGDRVSKETDNELCLRYLAGRTTLSNEVRSVEIQKRSLDCSSVVTQREVEIERRILEAERKANEAERQATRAQRAADDAAFRAQRASDDAAARARKAEQRRRDLEMCARGMRTFCN